jgi:hypothetical protein
MRGSGLRSTLVAVVGTAVLLLATAIVSAQESEPSQPEGDPPIEGPMDNSEISDEPMPVAGPDGEWIRCPDGELLQASPLDWMLAPNVGESERTAESDEDKTVYRVTEPIVARCGPGGGGSDGQPVFVPEDVGAERTVAPRRYIRTQR